MNVSARISQFLVALLMIQVASTADACGPDSNCMIGYRHYRIAMPEGHDGSTPVGAIVFAHGFRGSAHGAMRNMSMRRMVSDMGLAFIAVKSAGPGWDIPGTPSNMVSTGEAEFAYFEAVVRDVTERFAIDANRMMMTGFSAGGMLAWNLACFRPNLFAGFAPISGTFWLGPPDQCAHDVTSIIHIHGTEDRTVPLQGRRIRQTKQGDVAKVLEMYQRHGGFQEPEIVDVSDMTCARRSNSSGDLLEFCTFPGGHSFRPSFVEYAWSRLTEAGKL